MCDANPGGSARGQAEEQMPGNQDQPPVHPDAGDARGRTLEALEGTIVGGQYRLEELIGQVRAVDMAEVHKKVKEQQAAAEQEA